MRPRQLANPFAGGKSNLKPRFADKDAASPQNEPVIIRGANNEARATLKIDSVKSLENTLLIEGWCIGHCTISLLLEDRTPPYRLKRTKRSDVALALGVTEPDSGFGFTLETEFQSGQYGIEIKLPNGQASERYRYPIKIETTQPPRVSVQMKSLGFIEVAATSNISSDTVIVGWAVHPRNASLWIEDEQGARAPLNNAFRLFRQDVNDAYGGAMRQASPEAGFILRTRQISPDGRVKLIAQTGGTPEVLCEATCSQLPTDAVAASRWLFGLYTPTDLLHRRLPMIDIPIIDALREFDRASWRDLPVHANDIGNQIPNPLVSVVVPLYGRIDFVENQLIEFSRDSWLRKNAEIIYVVDDQRLVDPFRREAELLHRLYEIPFKWVWGRTNRGFSGANNLGAQHARGDYLVFLNSDAFPQSPGWIEPMLEVLTTRNDIGAVGPRLVFPDGSIQHCGMEFSYRKELGIWINHHPCMGLDPSLDPHRQLTVLPAITGACITISRAHLCAIDGWDSGYLIGDFEDSDLCLKLRNTGLKVAYLPSIQLTHLERQSFKLLGQDDFRSRVVMHNAVRHQTKWKNLLERSPAHSE